jgi:hypothetical protein
MVNARDGTCRKWSFLKKIFEVPSRSSVPGLTASHDSERFAL